MEKGSNGFSQKYWKHNYSDPTEMDCIGNVDLHARYLQTIFDMEYIDISTLVDFGFGLGHFFEKVLKIYNPFYAEGIEPSAFAFEQVNPKDLRPVKSTEIKLLQMDLATWCRQKKEKRIFDLGICTSVFQYLSDAELEFVIPIMAKRVKYLYLTVPTNKELDRQVEDHGFNDHFAKRRTRKKYYELLSKNFTFVSSRILESKKHFNEKTTYFTDLLYRF